MQTKNPAKKSRADAGNSLKLFQILKGFQEVILSFIPRNLGQAPLEFVMLAFLRVLIVHNQYRIRGGEDVVVERESRLLEESDVVVGHHLRKSTEIQGLLDQARTALFLSFSERECRSLQHKIREFRPDIVHVHNYFPLLTPAVFTACERERVPVVHTLHNFRIFCANGLLLRGGKNCALCLERHSPWPGVRYGCYRGSTLRTLPVANMIHRREEWENKVSKFIAVTEFARAKFIEAGLPAEKLVVKPNFSPDLAPLYPRREGKYAVYVGRLSEEKGIRTLLSAWRKISLPLRVVGNGPLAGLVREAGHELVEGATPESVAGALAAAEFLVMPSECYEGAVPLVLLEAMALGVPVVTSRFGAATEYFREGENAWLFSPGIEAELLSAVERCRSDSAARLRMAGQGRQLYEREFRPERNSQLLKRIYAEVIESRSSESQS